MILGITGGIGCGKSTVMRMLAAAGFECIDSDALIRDRILKSPVVIAAVEARFGAHVIDATRQIDRSALAGVIFTCDEDREWLEQMIHPLLFGEWRAALRVNPDGPWAIEVPLLFEKQLENWFDFTVCVASSPLQQLVRLELRGISRPLAEQRISKQLPLSKKIALSDFVLWNEGSLTSLQDQVDLMVAGLKIRG